MIWLKATIDKSKYDYIKDYYKIKELPQKKNSYVIFEHNTELSVNIKCYRTKNPELFTIVFSGGEEAKIEASFFLKDYSITDDSIKKIWDSEDSQIGSDEVGVGDFFGPIVVTACYLNSTDIKRIDNLGIKDSKKLNDNKILDLGEQLLSFVKKKTVAVHPNKLYQLIQRGWSSHKVLAMLHNKVQMELVAEFNLTQDIPIYIDQFEPSYIYLNYLDTIVPNKLIFQTKGESHYPSIATSSVLARYSFLKYWELMEKEIGMEIPKGAGSKVDEVFTRLKKNTNIDVDKYVKKNFKNYTK